MELRLVETIVIKLPFLGRPVVIGKDRAENVGQSPVIVRSEVSQFNWECGRLQALQFTRGW